MPRPRSLPLVGDLPAFRADRLGFVTGLARDDGDVATFRIGPYRVWLLSHPEHVRDVLVEHAARFRKGPVLQRARLVLGDGLLTAEGAYHRRHRRVLQPAFHPDRVARHAPTMVSRAAATTDRWRAGHPVDVHADMVRMTLETAGIALFGHEVAEDVDLVERAIDDLLSAYRLAFVPFGWRLQRLPFGPPRRLRQGRATLHGLVDRLIDARRNRDRGAGDDLLSQLVLDEALTDEELRDEVLTLLLAGHETTANALAFTCHLMAEDRALQAGVHAEVDELPAGRTPTAEDVDRLPFCRGLIAEALRLFPPSWAIGRQALEPHPAGDQMVRPDDLVVVSPWVIHRDGRWWPEPERADPARWSDLQPADRPRWAYLPFGAGVRRCIGEGFAWTEAVLALATIARRWRFSPVADRPLVLDPVITLRPRDGLWLVPHARPGP